VDNAQSGIDKFEAKPMTAQEFNEKEEKKKQEAAAAIPESTKKAVMKDGKYLCANPGCMTRYFTDEDNTETSCSYHKGGPVFHDVKKYWSCCPKTVAYEFEEFQVIERCTTGPH
jgi:disease resistance protein